MWKHKIEDDGKILFWKDEENDGGQSPSEQKMQTFWIWDTRDLVDLSKDIDQAKLDYSKKFKHNHSKEARRVIRTENDSSPMRMRKFEGLVVQ
jgi:hypothetical protein